MENNANQNEAKPKQDLTPAQHQVWEFIKGRLDATGISPTYREIQSHFGFKAIASVQEHVRALIKKGALQTASQLGENKSRRARGLLPAGYRNEALKRIPVYGEIAAGPTRDAEQLKLGSLAVSEEMAKGPCFALRVVGESMIEAGIFEGDLLVVQRGARVKNGDIIVALLNGETTVKRYEVREGKTFLIPENKKMKPIPVDRGSLMVQGKVIGLQRKFF